MQLFMWTQQHDEPAAEVLKLQKPKHVTACTETFKRNKGFIGAVRGKDNACLNPVIHIIL